VGVLDVGRRGVDGEGAVVCDMVCDEISFERASSKTISSLLLHMDMDIINR